MFTRTDVIVMAGNMHHNGTDVAGTDIADADVATLSAPVVSEEVEDTSDDTASALLAELMADDTDETAEEETELYYTTATMGDLPGTSVIEASAGVFNGRTLRIVAVPTSGIDAQRQQYTRQGCMFWTTERFHKVYGVPGFSEQVAQNAIAISASDYAGAHAVRSEVRSEVGYALEVMAQSEAVPTEAVPTEAVPTEVAPTEVAPTEAVPTEVAPTEVAQATDAEQAILAAQALVNEAKTEAEEVKALEDLLKAKREAAKVKAALAAKAVQDAPVIITDDLQSKIDRVRAIVAQGEQAIAKAFTHGLLYVKGESKAKKDTGTIRSVPQTPSSSGLVDVHRHGSNATVVSSSNRTLSEEKIAAIRRIKAILANMPEGMVADAAVARSAGLEPKLGSKLVWHIRNGSYSDITA